MRLQKLNNIAIVFFVSIATASLFNGFAADHLQQLSNQAVEKRWQAFNYADQLMSGSKLLTNAVRSFAATGDSKYQQAYHDEVHQTRSRDKAVEGLKALETPRQELALVEEAKLMSDALIELENRAFAAGRDGDLKLAVALVYGPEYDQALQRIYEPINRFRDKLAKRTDAEVALAQQQAEEKRFGTHIANAGSYFVLLLMMIFIYKRKIIRPIIELSAGIQIILKGNHTYAIAYQDQQNEIGELAGSLEQYRKVTQAMDAQNWIETNIGKVIGLIQQAETESDLARGLLSYISPLLDVGHAALYAYEPLKQQLCLTGAYGCQPSEEHRCFALGESLVGQCALEKTEIILTDLPDDYIRIRSALGDAKPNHLYLLPILLQERLLGVIELASFRAFNEHQLTFLSGLMPTLAMTMEVLSRNLQTRKLLQETQEQAQRMEKQAALLEEQTIELEAQQAELKETEAWYRSIIESAPQGMLVCDEAGTIILCNPMAEMLFGYDRGELMGSNVDRLVSGSIHAEFPRLWEKFLSSNGYRRIETGMTVTGVRKDGSEFPLEASLSLLSALGSHGGCISIAVREGAGQCPVQ